MTSSTIIPCLRYKDAKRMIDWLCGTFGTTQSPYVVVADADALYRRAKAAGAEIVIEIKDEDYGGRDFSCRDSEGHLWNIGTYDPWKT